MPCCGGKKEAGKAGGAGADKKGADAAGDNQTALEQALANHQLERHFKEGGFSNSNFIKMHKSEKITNTYDVEKKQLGAGTYGVVSKAMHKRTNAPRAIKSISLSHMQGSAKKRLTTEIQIMKYVDHPNIIKLFEVYEDAKQLHLVMELCVGGELFDRIVDNGQFSERQCASIMKQIFRCIYYLHSNGIMHRDLKPENFLFVEKNLEIEKCTLKLIDFGLSCPFEQGQVFSTKAGTPYYVSPQVLKGSYDEKCDVWSCGVMMYIMLCGYPPFMDDTEPGILAKVKSGNYKFDALHWKDVSADAKGLIKKTLTLDAGERTSAHEALMDSWIQHQAPKAKAISLAGNMMTHLSNFTKSNQFRRAALHVIATHMNDEQIKHLKTLFAQLDVNGDGQLGLSEMKDGLIKAGLQDDMTHFEDILTGLDSDGSGSIDYTEFLAATLDKRQYLKEDVCWEAFQVFDKNGDGVIDRSELAEILQDGKLQSMFEGQIDEILKEVDANGDGSIDFGEFMTMMKMDKSKSEKK